MILKEGFILVPSLKDTAKLLPLARDKKHLVVQPAQTGGRQFFSLHNHVRTVN